LREPTGWGGAVYLLRVGIVIDNKIIISMSFSFILRVKNNTSHLVLDLVLLFLLLLVRFSTLIIILRYGHFFTLESALTR